MSNAIAALVTTLPDGRLIATNAKGEWVGLYDPKSLEAYVVGRGQFTTDQTGWEAALVA